MLKKTLPYIAMLISLIILSGCMVRVRGMYVARPHRTVVIVDDDPELVVIPGTYVYYYYGEDGDYFFYDGFWWRSMNNVWYRADYYTGPWVLVDPIFVPYDVINLPPGWRNIPDYAVRVRWGDVRSHWHNWKRDRYWEMHRWRNW